MNIINVVAVIALPNERSVKLHEKYNFKTVGIFTKIGYKHEEWIDVIYMQKVLQEPRYHSLTIDEDENNNTTTTTAGSATNGDGNTLDNEIEMVEPIAYPECSQQLHDILKLLE